MFTFENTLLSIFVVICIGALAAGAALVLRDDNYKGPPWK